MLFSVPPPRPPPSNRKVHKLSSFMLETIAQMEEFKERKDTPRDFMYAVTTEYYTLPKEEDPSQRRLFRNKVTTYKVLRKGGFLYG